MGGIVGINQNYENVIYECKNYGDIVGENIDGYVAGIISYANSSMAKLINNENYGNVTVKSFNESTNASSYYNIASIAGICAYKNYDILLYDCKNKGNITIENAINSKKSTIYIAGIAGSSSGSTGRLSEKLYNYGKITVKNY